uniref:Transmembrane protein n=1 Tax=Loa loa TaxID=7209 RepID=A0A1I7V9H4_LOALO
MPLNNLAMTRLCQIPARHTGIASLCIQLIGLVMSAALTLHLILHLNSITISRNIKQQLKRPAATYTMTLINITKMNVAEISENMNLPEEIIWNRSSASNVSGNSTNGEIGLQLDLTELIQISTSVYAGLDLIIMNSVLLTIAMIYAITHALFVSILFIYHKQIPWITLAITSTVVLGFALTSIICGFALAFNVAWYRYVVYVNDNDQCICPSIVAHLCKQHRQQQQRPTQDYSIAEATRHSNLSHDNEFPIHSFSRL